MTAIQHRLRNASPDLKRLDRAAHQYQIAGGKVWLRIADRLPAEFPGVGLFVPGAQHLGVGRVSTSLGFPHVETIPDFLGLRASFLSASGRPVDLLGVSSPALPVDNRLDGLAFLRATADAAGPHAPRSGHLAVDPARMRASLVKSMSVGKGEKTLALIVEQSARTARARTACQSYWTGVVAVRGTLGRFALTAVGADGGARCLDPGERYLTRDWMTRQSAQAVVFDIWWIRYLDERRTSLHRFTQPWPEAHKSLVGQLVFPRTDPLSEEARLWSALASEMAANPGNWIADAGDSVREPATAFELTRQLAYERSARGRDALSLDAYRASLQAGRIDDQLAAELRRRMQRKRSLGHLDQAPAVCAGAAAPLR